MRQENELRQGRKEFKIDHSSYTRVVLCVIEKSMEEAVDRRQVLRVSLAWKLFAEREAPNSD